MITPLWRFRPAEITHLDVAALAKPLIGQAIFVTALPGGCLNSLADAVKLRADSYASRAVQSHRA
jgi:hypothetical protein